MVFRGNQCFVLQLSNNWSYAASSHGHGLHAKTAAGVKKMSPRTQMILNECADYDLEAAGFVSYCALLCGQGPFVLFKGLSGYKY